MYILETGKIKYFISFQFRYTNQTKKTCFPGGGTSPVVLVTSSPSSQVTLINTYISTSEGATLTKAEF